MHTGRCACGAVTFRMSSDPLIVHGCHCTDCQRLSGSAYAVNALIEADRVSWDGETTEVLLPTPSGKGQRLIRCATCGTAIFSEYLIREGKIRNVKVGTLDHPEACPPDVHIYTSTKLPFVTLDDGKPVFDAAYDQGDVWTEAALRRRDALYAR